jgi:hypothetical protein
MNRRGNTMGSERERRVREWEQCRHCGRDIYREQMTRGRNAGEWRSVDLEGKPHRCAARTA